MRLACRRVWRFAARSSLNRAAARLSQMVVTQPPRRAREAVHAALGDDRPHTDTPPPPRQPAISRPRCFTSSRRGRTKCARSALASTLSQARELGTASQTTARTRRAHSQHTHDAHTSPLPLASTAKMQFGAACRRMCSSMRSQHSLTMDLQHVRVLAAQLYQSIIQHVNLLKSGIRPVPRRMSLHSEAWRDPISNFGIIHTSR